MDQQLTTAGFDKNKFNEEEKTILHKLINNEGSKIDISQYTEEELHCLPLFFKAEIVTLWPNLGGDGDLQGKVNIIRQKEDGSRVTLKYMEANKFNEYVEKDKTKAEKYYTLDGNYNIVIANSTEYSAKYNYSSGYSGEKNSDYNHTEVGTLKFAYKDLISKYTITFEFLQPLLIITKNPDFCTDIANNIYNNSYIDLVVYDNTTTTSRVYTQKNHDEFDYNFTCYTKYDYTDVNGAEHKDHDITYKDYSEHGSEDYDSTVTYTTTSTTIIPSVEKAETTFFSVYQKYILNTLPSVVETDNGTTSEKNLNEASGKQEKVFQTTTNIENEIKAKLLNGNSNISTIDKIDVKTSDSKTYKEKYIKSRETQYTLTTTTTTNEYVKSTNPSESIVSFKGAGAGGFYDIFAKDDKDRGYEIARNHLYELRDRLFSMLLSNSVNGQTYVNIIKYVFYIYSGDAGDFTNEQINELLEMFKADSFNAISGSNAGCATYDYLRIWENTQLYKYYIKETSSCPKYADGEYYKVFYGGSKDTTYNLAYGIVISRNYNDNYFNKKGVNATTLRSYQTDGQIFTQLTGSNIEEIFEDMINTHKTAVETEVDSLGLEQSQIDALTAIHYQYGNIGNFVTAYNTYYKTGDYQGFQQNFKVSGMQPLLINSTNNKEKRSGENSRVGANWKLFNQGIYSGNGYVLDTNRYSNSGSGSDVVSFAMQFIGKNGSQMSSILNYQGEWCAAFASYCYEQCGLIPDSLSKKQTYCREIVKEGKSNGRFHLRGDGYIPKAGDFILYDWNGKKDGVADHIGIVTSCNGKKAETIEGNTGKNGSWQTRVVNTYTRKLDYEEILGWYSL